MGALAAASPPVSLRPALTAADPPAGASPDAQLLLAVFDTMPECLKIVSAEGRLLRMNPAGLQMIGAADEDAVRGQLVIDLISGEHRAMWQVNHEKVCAGQKVSWEFEMVGLNGVRRYMETHAAPCPMPDGAVAHLAITHDITRRKQAERQQKLLIDELNHRVKNTLAIVQSIAAQTFFRGAPNRGVKAGRGETQSYRWFEGRLIALAEAHDLLTRESWESARIHEIVSRALAPHRLGENRIVMTGPELRLTPKVAVSLALAMHELATNAVKYGALSTDAGRVDVTWREDTDNGPKRVHLRWAEADGPPVKKPRRKGFGTRLIQDGLAREYKGAVSMDFLPTGLICTLDVPLA